MKCYDISQEVFSCAVYPGDTAPVKTEERRMSRGDTYNLTSFSMCAHNGTHMDAPFHFLADGAAVEILTRAGEGKYRGSAYLALRKKFFSPINT